MYTCACDIRVFVLHRNVASLVLLLITNSVLSF